MVVVLLLAVIIFLLIMSMAREDAASKRDEEKAEIQPCYFDLDEKLTPKYEKELALYADSIGIDSSSFVDKYKLFVGVIRNCTDKERAEFFAYCVLCDHYGTEIGNLKTCDKADYIYRFAELSMKDPALTKTIEETDAADYYEPNKESIAYKAVAEFFDLK